MHIILIIAIILHFVCAYYLRKKFDEGRNPETVLNSIVSSVISVVTNSIYHANLLLNNGFILVYYDIYRYTLLEFLLQSIYYIIATDLMLYFVHRFLHSKILYKYVHYFHHTNTYPTALDFASVHPLENLIVFTTFHIVPFIIPVYIATLELYIVHVGMRSLLEHGNGWKILSNIPILKYFYNDHHNIHHKYYNVNYGIGSFPTLWDKIFNTLHD